MKSDENSLLLETRITHLHFASDSIGLSSFKTQQTDRQTHGQTTYCATVGRLSVRLSVCL